MREIQQEAKRLLKNEYCGNCAFVANDFSFCLVIPEPHHGRINPNGICPEFLPQDHRPGMKGITKWDE